MKLAIWMALMALPAFAQTPPINEIMVRVAENQAKSVEARRQYVYRQDELISLHKSNGKLACEQKRQYTVTPGPKGVVKHVVTSGASGDGSCSVNFEDGSGKRSGVGPDGVVTESFSDEAGSGHSADGIPHDLFPLTASEQRLYAYTIKGTETYHGRKVYRIAFQPNHNRDKDGDEGYWKGETLIDAEEFQPVLVSTDLTVKVPMAVRILLGTNVRGVGFTVTYERMPDGVWFPAGYGGEFEVHALFFIRRTVAINVKNSDFRRTDVASSVAFDSDKQ